MAFMTLVNTNSLINKPIRKFHEGKMLKKILKNWTNNALATELWKQHCDCAPLLEDPKVVAALKALATKLESSDVRDRMFNQAGNPQTLLHGDIHGWNHMFPKPGVQADVPVYSVDFQMVGSGRVTWDLAYFFAQSVAPSYEADMRMLRVYYDHLLMIAANNPYFSITSLPFEEFRKEFIRITFLTCLTLINLTSIVHSPKFMKTQQDKDDGGKGDTLTYATMKIWKRMYTRAVDYVNNGALEHL